MKNKLLNKKVANDKSQTTQINEKKIKLMKFINKISIVYFILILLDIILVIYSARKNVINYAVFLGEEVFVSKTKYLLFGRNYINIIITVFFYVYVCLINKFFLKIKNTKKIMILLMLFLVILNVILFALFTKKVY